MPSDDRRPIAAPAFSKREAILLAAKRHSGSTDAPTQQDVNAGRVCISRPV
jgi:hypothetical protein